MTEITKQKPPFWFWIIAVVGLLWNGLGVNQYLHQAYKTDALKEMYPDPKIYDMILNTPSWVMAAFATAVFFGLLGCLLLLLRKKWAYPMFIISLLGIVAQMIYNIFMSGAMEVYGPGAVLMPLTIFLFGLLLLWFTKKSIKQQWVN